jgi:hypothetical protein
VDPFGNPTIVRSSCAKSSGDRAMAKLVTHVPDYNKGLKNIYALLAPKIPDAMQNAVRLQRENTRTRSSNPSTRVHEPVKYLITLKAEK